MNTKQKKALAEINKMFDDFMIELRKNVLNMRKKKAK